MWLYHYFLNFWMFKLSIYLLFQIILCFSLCIFFQTPWLISSGLNLSCRLKNMNIFIVWNRFFWEANWWWLSILFHVATLVSGSPSTATTPIALLNLKHSYFGGENKCSSIVSLNLSPPFLYNCLLLLLIWSQAIQFWAADLVLSMKR